MCDLFFNVLALHAFLDLATGAAASVIPKHLEKITAMLLQNSCVIYARGHAPKQQPSKLPS